MSKNKVAILTVSALSSLALVGSGAYNMVSAEGGIHPFSESTPPPPVAEEAKPEASESTPPQGEAPKPFAGQKETKPEVQPEKPVPKSDPQPEPEKPEPKAEPKSDEPKAEPKEQPKSESKESESSPSASVKSDSKPSISGNENKVVADAGNAASSTKKSEEGKEEESSKDSDGKTAADEPKEEVKGQKMAKTGFNPVPFAQLAAGLFGLGGTALYGMRRKSTDD